MSEYILQDDLYLGVTPAGSFYASQGRSEDLGRDFLQRLLRNPETPRFSQDLAAEYSHMKNDDALQFVHWLQEAGLLYGRETTQEAPQQRLEDILPELLEPLADSGKVILASAQGFYLGVAGFNHEAAEELAAMSTELIKTYERHKTLLEGNLRLKQKGWGLVDGTGSSEIAFWPLYIGNEVFSLIVEGLPQFNQEAFKDLIWALTIRYDNRII